MKNFTFVMITYNQEQFVTQHFKSIIYQINKYGSNVCNNIIIADDCSNDDTVFVLKNLLEEYKEFFNEVKIIVQKENVGIVKNHTSALMAIRTEYFKILAGDDMYYKNNIYKEIDGKCFNICPTIMFNENNSWFANEMFHKSLILRRNNPEKLIEYLEKNLQLHIAPYAPSVFYNKSVVTDGLYEYLNTYHWIEDLPSYDYIYKNNKPSITISIKPLTLYRMNSGISTNTNHCKNLEFEKEKKLINETICPRYKDNKFLNPYHYLRVANNYFDKVRYNKSNDISILDEQFIDISKEVNDYFYQLERI